MTQNTPFADLFKNWDESLKGLTSGAPAFDFNQAVEAGQKNMEAFATAQKTLMEGFQRATKRQIEIAQENSESILKLFGEVSSSKDPKESAEKQADFAQSLVKKSTDDAQEVATILAESGQKAAELVSAQVDTNMEAAQGVAKQAQKKATSAAAKAAA